MPRRTYAQLGYTVFRARHVVPNGQMAIIDALARRWHVGRDVAVDMVVARWIGHQEAFTPPHQDPDFYAVTEEALPVEANL